MSPARLSMLWMIAFVALWAVVEVLAADLLRRYSPYQVVWMRYTVHLVFMGLVWGWREPGTLWRTRRLGYQLARSMLMVGMPAFWVLSMQHGVDAQTTMSVFWLSPLLILAFAATLQGDRAAWPVWLAGALGFVGVNLLFRYAGAPHVRSLILPLCMGACFSLYVVMTRSLRTESTRTNLFYSALGVWLVLSPAMPSLWIAPLPGDLPLMVAIGLLGFGSLYALDRMAHCAPVSAAAPLAYLQLVPLIGLGWAAGHSHPGVRAIAGLLLIGVAALCLWLHQPAFRAAPGPLARG